MGAPIIFSGSDAKLLKSNLDFNGQSKILSGSVDPTSVATSAPIGSLYLNSSTGAIYKKNDAGSTTNWSLLGTSTATNTAARYYSSSTTISSSLATIVYATQDYDPSAAYSAGVFTAPTAGKYVIAAGLLISGTVALNNTLVLEIQKNNSVVSRFTEYFPSTLTDGKAIIVDTINLAQGDTVRIQASTTVTGPSIVSSNFDNYFSAALIAASPPSTPAFIGSAYYMSANKTPSGVAQYDFDTVIYDTNSAVTTGTSWKYTAATAGYYRIGGFMSGPTSTNILGLYKNGTLYEWVGGAQLAGGGASVTINTVIKLAAGDYIDFRAATGSQTYYGGTLSASYTSHINIQFEGA